MKRKMLLALAMTASMAVSLTACGSGTQATSGSSGGEAKTEAKTPSGGQSMKLTWSEVNGEDYGATVGAKEFAKKIEELSGGQITVELYLNGTLGNEKESMQGIQMGTLDIFRGNASSLSNYGASKISLSGLPFLFKDMDQFEKMAKSKSISFFLSR